MIRSLLHFGVLLSLGLSVLGATTVVADEGNSVGLIGEYSGSVAIEEFRPVEPGQVADTVSATLMVAIAYSLMWIFVVLFLFALWRRSQRREADVAALEGRLNQLDQQLADRLGDGS